MGLIKLMVLRRLMILSLINKYKIDEDSDKADGFRKTDYFRRT